MSEETLLTQHNDFFEILEQAGSLSAILRVPPEVREQHGATLSPEWTGHHIRVEFDNGDRCWLEMGRSGGLIMSLDEP